MIFEFQNLGSIKKASLEMGNLTVVCGKNNTGKTYLTYAVWGFMSKWKRNLKEKEGKISFEKVQDYVLKKIYTQDLKEIFNTNSHFFKDTIFEIQLKKEDIYFPTPFILSAERTSASLFQKELNRSRDELIKAKLFDNLKENVSSLSLPVQMNLDFERDIEQIQKENSYISEKHPELLAEVENILGVNYLVLEGKLLLQSENDFIPFYLCSTSVRSLAQLHLWIKHKARLGDLLMIDEPELNLHPENQVKIARLLVKLVNIGIKVWITTHSDYIIKELNNCLMFSNDFQDKAELMQEFGYSKMDILNPNDLRAYIAADNTVYPVKIDKFGMNMTTFDEEIAKINHISNELSNAIR